MIWTILMYVCLVAGIVLLGFGIYGFVYTPSSPSEVLNTEVDGSNKSNCDPNEAGAKDATVTCDGDNDCVIKCQQSDAKCISKSVKNNKTNKMESANVCMVSSIKKPTSVCNAYYGGELVLQPSADGNSMVWGCQCNYSDYVSENPGSGKEFCQLLPNVCKNGKFNWNAENEAPEDATCVCPDNYKMVKDFNGVPTCIENSKLGAAIAWNSKDKDYESTPKASGSYPCLGNNSFC